MLKKFFFLLALSTWLLYPTTIHTAEDKEIEMAIVKFKNAVKYLEGQIIKNNLEIKKERTDIDLIKLFIKNSIDEYDMRNFFEMARAPENEIALMKILFFGVCKKGNVIAGNDDILNQYGRLRQKCLDIISKLERQPLKEEVALIDAGGLFFSAALDAKNEIIILDQKNKERESTCDESVVKLFKKIEKKEKKVI